MEPLNALGLARNVVQFVQFSSQLISTTVELHRSSSGCTDDILTLETLYEQLSDFNAEIMSGIDQASKYLDGPGSKSDKNRDSFRTLSDHCKSDCEDLLRVVGTLKVQGESRRRWQSFRMALKTIWKKDEIQELEQRLQKTQMAMTFHICALASQAQDAHADRLAKLQIENNKLQFDQDAKLDAIIATLGELKHHIKQANKRSAPSFEEIDSLKQCLSGLTISQNVVEEEQKILKSLSFEARPIRHTSIPEADKRTFKWAYEPDEAAQSSAKFITRWLKKENGIFWVSGKPGSGKSTFMKFIADEPRTPELLSDWSDGKRVFIVSHYFWSAGTAMQKSQQGLLRTLLYGIFRQCSELIWHVCESLRSELDKDEDLLQWSLRNLSATLKKVATWDTTTTRFCFFIDGLDEYDGDHDELCQILQDVAKSPNIKICLSSRPWNLFEEAFGNETQNKVYMQDMTRNDILKYIRCRLHEHPRWPALVKGESKGDMLIEEIANRSSGVFLWVFLVTKLLREGLTNRDSFRDIRQRLESFPLELDVFFRRILESVEPFYHDKMSTMMQMAMSAGEPLHAMAYDFHDREYEEEDYVFRVPVRPLNSEEKDELMEQTRGRLQSRSRGLLEINLQSGTVTFLHRTVLDFLRTQEMSTFLADKTPPGFNLASSLLKVYTSIIKRSHFKEPLERQDFGLYKGCYLQFLAGNALACAAELEKSDPHNTLTYEIIEHLDHIFDENSHSLVSFMCERSMRGFIREQLIKEQHMGYLTWKLPREPNYLSRLGPSLIPHILVRHGDQSSDTLNNLWQSRGIEMLRLVMETQNINPNEQPSGINPRVSWSPWTALITYTGSGTSNDSLIAEQFWNLLKNDIISKLLQKAANPNAIIWCDYPDRCSAFAAYLNLAFEAPSDTVKERLYLRTLKEFLFAGAIMDVPQHEFMDLSIFQTPMMDVKLISASEKFFGRLRNIHTIDRITCNFRLLAEVVDMLLSTIVDSSETLIMETIKTAVETAFPTDICALLKDRYTAIKWANGPNGRKRRNNLALDMESVKVQKVSPDLSIDLE